jgi:hypothetical protein
MFKVDEGNIITPQNKIIARKCYAILRKEIQFCFDGLKRGVPSENLIQIYENFIHICMTETRQLEKYFIEKIRRKIITNFHIPISLYLELKMVESTKNFKSECCYCDENFRAECCY